jgi:hypothetical protein
MATYLRRPAGRDSRCPGVVSLPIARPRRGCRAGHRGLTPGACAGGPRTRAPECRKGAHVAATREDTPDRPSDGTALAPGKEDAGSSRPYIWSPPRKWVCSSATACLRGRRSGQIDVREGRVPAPEVSWTTGKGDTATSPPGGCGGRTRRAQRPLARWTRPARWPRPLMPARGGR